MSKVKIVEVGPRDGLQNISKTIPTATKIELIESLAATGLSTIEATSFVSPKWIPQLADATDVLKAIRPLIVGQKSFPVLVPNVQGLDLAIKHSVKEIAVFVSATEAFSKRNINCTVAESLERAQIVIRKALSNGMRVRGYVSCIFQDPYTGPTDASQVLNVARALLRYGCYEVSLGDTTGVGTPADVARLFRVLLLDIPAGTLAGHFHDTYGQAIANAVKAYELGIRTFDSSVAGLGGCPFAKGARGNLATEDLIYTLHKMGVETGVDLNRLVEVGAWISEKIQIANSSRAGSAIATKLKEHSTGSTRSLSRVWKPVSCFNEYRVDRSGASIKITLTRPKNGNTLTTEMIRGLTKVYCDLATAQDIFRVILTAEGKFFCTGMDLKDSSITSDERYALLDGLFHAIDTCPKQTIAAVNGPCFGGGVGLAFVCDLRLLSHSATFTLSEVKLGVCPATISKYVIREWGFAFSRAAMLTGRAVKAEELLALGVVLDVIPDVQALDGRLESLLMELRGTAPRASTLCKKLVSSAWRDAGSHDHERTIKEAFDEMMAAGSESVHGFREFGKGVKSIDWEAFYARPSSKL